MRVLLDECLPRRLTRDLPGHEVRTVPESGWAGKNNGALLQLAEGAFDAFITVDRALPSQQNLTMTRLVVVILSARSNRLDDLRPLMPVVLNVLTSAEPGQVIRIPPHTPIQPTGSAGS